MATKTSQEDLRAEAARIMGMKLREVVSAARVDDGLVATTHDGKHTLIRDDGSMEFDVAAPPASEDTSPPAAPERKGRGRE